LFKSECQRIFDLQVRHRMPAIRMRALRAYAGSP
jgi:hypothetical protein